MYLHRGLELAVIVAAVAMTHGVNHYFRV